jgi:hypothetical protein
MQKGKIVKSYTHLDSAVLLLVELEDSMDNGNVSAVDLEDHNLPYPDVLLLVVGQEQQISSLKKGTSIYSENPMSRKSVYYQFRSQLMTHH